MSLVDPNFTQELNESRGPEFYMDPNFTVLACLRRGVQTCPLLPCVSFGHAGLSFRTLKLASVSEISSFISIIA